MSEKKTVKKILISPLLFMESLIDRILAAAGALIFMQIPSFMIQYVQRLGGHVDELNEIVKKYKAAAAENSRPLEEYIQLHIQSGVKEFASTGRIMSENIERLANLKESYELLSSSSGINKFLLFIRKADSDIVKGTYRDFTPGISFNIDSLIYAAAGIAVFMSLYLLFKKTITVILSRFTSGR